MTATISTGSGPRDRWPARCASAALLIVALCGIAVAQSPPKEQSPTEEQVSTAQAPAAALPNSTDPAELRRLAKGFHDIAQSNVALRALEEQERQALMAKIASGEALPLEARLIPQSETTADLRHESALHFQALSDSFAREADLREKVQKLRGESESLAKAGETERAKQLAKEADRELANAEVAAAERMERERLLTRTQDFRDGLRLLEDKAAALRQDGKYPQAAAMDLEIRQHVKNPLLLEAIAVGARAEEPIIFRFVLTHARAADALATLRQLGNTLHDWIVEERTNTIFARGPRAEIYRLSESIDELDQPVKEPLGSRSNDPQVSSVTQVAPAENSANDTGGETQTTTRQVPTVLGAAVQALQPHDAQRSDGAHIRVYKVQHVRAEEACDLIANNWGLSPTIVSGRIVVAGTPQDHEGIAALLAKLDVPELAAVDPVPVNPGRGEQPMPNPPAAAIDEQHIEDSLPKLRAAYAAAEQLAQSLKAKFKPSAKPIPKDNPLRVQLRAAVAKSFEARQQLLRAELIEFRQRMDRLGQCIEHRSRIADQIIDRRVEDLLNPSSKWDPPESPAEAVAPDATADTAERTTAADLDLDILQGRWTVTKAIAARGRSFVEHPLRGALQFTKDRVDVLWDQPADSSGKKPPYFANPFHVVLNGATDPREITLLDYGDERRATSGLYWCEESKLILALPFNGVNVTTELPRPKELLPAKDVLYLELKRQGEAAPAAAIPRISLLVTNKGQPVEGAVIDIFREAYQAGAVQPRVERWGMTMTDAAGRRDVELEGAKAIWKQEPRSGYLLYVSGPNRQVKCMAINGDSHLEGSWPISLAIEFDGEKTPAPYAPPLHLVIATRRGVTITPGSDKVQGFVFQDEGDSAITTPAKTVLRREGAPADEENSPRNDSP